MVANVSTANLAPALVEKQLVLPILWAALPPLQMESLGGVADPSAFVHATPARTQPYTCMSGTQPKRGRPLPSGPIHAYAEHTTPLRMVLTGPDFVGCSSILQGLHSLGHHIWQLTQRPATSSWTQFQAS